MNRKQIGQWIEKYRKALFLHAWQIDVSYLDKDIDASRGDCLAEAQVLQEYMKVHIKIYPAFFRKHKMRQEQALVHELCHCHTQQAWNAIVRLEQGATLPSDISTEIIEKLTQTISVIAMAK